ncbi:hypothetical protein D9758_000217 [Tetrapyrgos nigripes]|uniref:Uncharacterized protein n=1 Tax=Tetrapyrgos nigripes TaxID=182062 RepID=A0A8H5H198_9AGAR|nr:hypothetical protein D9758_000217 [Tetrapyrgos nigripes]
MFAREDVEGTREPESCWGISQEREGIAIGKEGSDFIMEVRERDTGSVKGYCQLELSKNDGAGVFDFSVIAIFGRLRVKDDQETLTVLGHIA